MANPLSGVITQAFKDTWNNAIDALLESTALTETCRIVYGTTEYTQCPNCILNTISRISSNIYNGTGTRSFPTGSICPICGGAGFIPSDTTEEISMAVIRNADRSKFIDLGANLDEAMGYIQTISQEATFPLIQKAQYVVINTAIEGYNGDRYQRVGDATLIGFGSRPYVVTIWNKVR